MTSSVGELTFNRALKLPMILQDERAECGHACVAMVSNYWGHRLDLYSIRGMSNTSSRGVTLLDWVLQHAHYKFRWRNCI
jgi:ATP-binding cassette subfamily B protein RaxB